MLADTLSTGTVGALFGVALMSSGIWAPQAIISQMKLQDFYMVKVFLTASASSAWVASALSSCVHNS